MNEFERETCMILRDLGVPQHLAGFDYLRDAVILTVHDPMLPRQMMKRLYPAVAGKYRSTPQRTERAMRHAVEAAWLRCDPEVLAGYFGNTVRWDRGKPANSEFIACISNAVRLGGLSHESISV